MKKKKMMLILGAVLVLAAASGIAWTYASGANAVKAVEAEILQARTLSQVISVTGNVEARDTEEINLSAQQKVKRLYAAENQEIKKGDLILTVDTTDLEYQLSKYRLNLDLAGRNLERLLKKDTKSDKRSLENAVRQAEISLANATADYNEATRKLAQNRVLFESGAISKEEYESSEKRMNDVGNQVALSEIQLSNSQNGLADFDTNLEDQIADQRNQIEGAKADIANTQEQIRKSEVKAGIDGKIVSLKVKENQYPSPDNAKILIYDLSEYKIAVEVSQYDAVSIRTGQKAGIKVKGLDKAYTGTVSRIDETAAVKTEGANKEAKVGVEITMDNPDDNIKAGYEADIDITLVESPGALAVNFEALKEDGGGKYVFVIENGIALKKYVETGIETDFDVQVVKGLQAGEQYIKNPPAELKDGDSVRTGDGR